VAAVVKPFDSALRASLGASGLLAALALGACGPDDIVMAPVIDGPAAGSDAAAFPDLDEVILTLAREGSSTDLLSASFARGDSIELRGVPEGDDLVLHMTGRLNGGDVAYGRTCAFDLGDDTPPAPHLWFARTVKWGDIDASPAAVRIGGRAITYRDGSVLFAGGDDETSQPVADLERFDPDRGVLERVAGLTSRRNATYATLGDGRLVVVGGTDPLTLQASPRLDVFELDTTLVGRVEGFDDVRLAREGATAVTLSDGRIVVFGGGPVGGDPFAMPVEIASDGATVAIRDLAASMAVPRRGATATRLSDDLGAPVLVAGGIDRFGALVTTGELWRPLREDFAAGFAPTMRVPRTRHQAVRMPDGSVLFIGGIDATGQPVRSLELFTTDGGFLIAGNLPPGAGLLDATVNVLPDGRVLVAGGRESPLGEPVLSAYIINLDPLDGSVDTVTTDRIARARAGHAAASLCDGTIVVLGGTNGASAVERYQPPPLARR
jgi:hypothetical protein